MIQEADTTGVFQIESRAQMGSLRRTRPETLEDLTIQVAIVRPGPIMGGAVNPYVERRQRRREDPTFQVSYLHPSLEPALRETLGTIIFQDQVIDVAQAFAGFSAGEAEGLRRAMSRKRSAEAMQAHHDRFVAGAMATHGVDAELAEAVYTMIVGFSGFGFPKAHGAAFGLLAYQSTWLRATTPRSSCARCWTSSPWASTRPTPWSTRPNAAGSRFARPTSTPARPPARWRTARRCASAWATCWACAPATSPRWWPPATPGSLPLAGGPGLARGRRTRLAGGPGLVGRLRRPGAGLGGLARRTALWQLGVAAPGRMARGVGRAPTQLSLPLELPAPPSLDPLGDWDEMVAGYATTGMAITGHPMALLRDDLAGRGAVTVADLGRLGHGTTVRVGGLVVARQRPATANGVVFLLLEDEHATVNVIVPPPVYQRDRMAVRSEPIVLAEGRLERHATAGGRSTCSRGACTCSRRRRAPGRGCTRCPTAGSTATRTPQRATSARSPRR